MKPNYDGDRPNLGVNHPTVDVSDDEPDRRVVTLYAVYEYPDDEVGDWSDEQLIEDAEEAFFLDGANLSAEVTRE